MVEQIAEHNLLWNLPDFRTFLPSLRQIFPISPYLYAFIAKNALFFDFFDNLSRRFPKFYGRILALFNAVRINEKNFSSAQIFIFDFFTEFRIYFTKFAYLSVLIFSLRSLASSFVDSANE